MLGLWAEISGIFHLDQSLDICVLILRSILNVPAKLGSRVADSALLLVVEDVGIRRHVHLHQVREDSYKSGSQNVPKTAQNERFPMHYPSFHTEDLFCMKSTLVNAFAPLWQARSAIKDNF